MNNSSLSESSCEKPKGGDEGRGEIPASNHKQCEECGKVFSSGKALGGHKRFHLQARRKEKESNNCNGSTKVMPNLKLSCYLCNKDFPSQKSLFGHMRSHPGREWKGVHPPNTPSGSSSPNSGSNIEENNNKDDSDSFGAIIAPSEEPAIDLSKSLPPSWHKTYKRGRECIYSDEVLDAARMLMYLNLGDWSFDDDGVCDKMMNNGGKPKISVNLDSEDNKGEEEYRVKKMKTEVRPNGVQDHVISHIDETKKKKKKDKKKEKLIVKLKAPCSQPKDEILPQTRESYQCGICDKSFSTFQALGGHRSSHNKEKNNNRNPGEESSQLGPQIRDFDLNELPDDSHDEVK